MPEPSPEIHRSQVTFKTVFTVCGGVLIVAGAVLATLNSLVAIGLTVAAVLLAVALDHLVTMLTRRGWRRGWAIAAVMVAFAGALVGVGFVLIPSTITQGRQLAEDFFPRIVPAVHKVAIVRRIEQHLEIGTTPPELGRALEKLIGGAGPVLSAVGSALSMLGGVVTVLFLTVFVLIFGGPLVKAALDEARVERRATYAKVLDKIYNSIGGYLGGLAVICSINTLLTSTFLWIDRVSFWLPLGILSGFSSAIPYAGPAVAGSFISLVAAATSGVWHGVAAGIYFLAYGQLEGNVLSPLVFRRTVHVNPLIVTLSILFFAEMAGIAGAVIAIPAVAALQIVLRELLKIRRDHLQRLQTQQGAQAAPAA
jgi:predicted PurR-regulated permease PerM